MPPLSRRALRKARAVVGTLRHGPRQLLALRLRSAGLVDRGWYELQTRRRWRSDLAAALHYLSHGRRAGLSLHPLLEPEWIAPVGWRARAEPIQTYLGGRSWHAGPHPAFDDATYLAENPRAGAHPGGVLGHFLRYHGADDPLPVPAGTAPTTLRQLRERLDAALGGINAAAEVRGVRTSTGWDLDADAAYVALWSAVQLPIGTDSLLVSIVLPVRNRPEQVRAAVESVQAQTFSGWELLVIDDGSTDSTPDVVAGLAELDPRIRLIRIEPSGASVARNAGLAAARGRFAAFLDSDNAWVPHFLAVTLAAMTTQGLRAAYAVVELRGPAGTRYLAHAGTRADLAFSNHIDLNVFVAELALVHQAGDFDPALRRMIDWDLALRAAALEVPVLLPFVGVHYTDDSGHGDRISVREPSSWGEVVLAKNLVDWAALARSVDQRSEPLTSLVVSVQDEWAHAVTLVDRALAVGEHAASDSDTPNPWTRNVEVVLVDRASRPATTRLLVGRYGADPRVRSTRQPRDGRVALAWCEGLALTTGSVVVLVDAGCTVRVSGAPLDRPWWAPLREALADPGVAAAAPLVLGPTGTVASAGLGTRGPGRPPYPMFDDCAPEDVAAGGQLTVGALGDDAVAARAADLIAAGGPSPWYVGGLWGADLSVRLARLGGGGEPARRVVVVPDSVLVTGSEAAPATALDLTGLLERVGSDLPSTDEWDESSAWGRAGLSVADVDPVDAVDAGAPGPTAVRRHAPVVTGPTLGMPAMRWAIKIAAPSSEQGDKWGDVHFAADLAAALQRLGQHVSVDRRPAHQRSTAHLDDVVLNLRGLATPSLRRDQVNLLWVISHPEQVSAEEIRGYDLAFAASLSWSAAMTRRVGVRVEPLLQATDPRRFHPDVAEPDTGPQALFVGNSRGVERPVVRDAITAGIELDVYGTRWKGFIDVSHVRGEYLANETVGAAYRSAGVLLNDHWADMAAEGFISNRVFDAVAAGARVISDPVEGIEETFSGAVLEYRTPDELARWAGPERDRVFPPESELLQISARVRAEHSFDARAARLLEAAVEVVTLRASDPPG